jgi:hypothetical protein
MYNYLNTSMPFLCDKRLHTTKRKHTVAFWVMTMWETGRWHTFFICRVLLLKREAPVSFKTLEIT